MNDFPGPGRGWMKYAVCASVDPEVWFPPKGSSTAQAKRICLGGRNRPGCPVRNRCLAYALINDEKFGVWGGMSERERSRLKKGKSQA